MGKLRAIVTNAETMSIGFQTAKVGEKIPEGRVVTLKGGKSVLLKPKQVYLRERLFFRPKMYIQVLDGDPRVVVLGESKENPSPMDSSTFNAAIGSFLRLKFLRSGNLDWRTIVMILLGITVLILAFNR